MDAGVSALKFSAEARDIDTGCCHNCGCSCFGSKSEKRHQSNSSNHHRKTKSTMEGTTVVLNNAEMEVEPLAQYELVKEGGKHSLRPKRVEESYGKKRNENSSAIDHCYNYYVRNYGSSIVAIVTAWQRIDFVQMYVSGKSFDHFSKNTVEQSLEKITPIRETFDFVITLIESFVEPVTSPISTAKTRTRDDRFNVSPLMLPKTQSSNNKKIREKFASLHISVGDASEMQEDIGDGGSHRVNKQAMKTPSPSEESQVVISSPSSDPISEGQQTEKRTKKIFLKVVQKLVGLKRAELTMIAHKLEHLRECPGKSKKLNDILDNLLMCSLIPSEATKILLVANTIHFCWKAIKRHVASINPAAKITHEAVLKAMERAEVLAPIATLPFQTPRGGSGQYGRLVSDEEVS